MVYFSCDQKDNNQHKHLKGNHVPRRQCSEAPVPLHCWSRAKFFHMSAWMKAIPGKMCISNWHSVNGSPGTWFVFVVRFWQVKVFVPSPLPKPVVDTQLLLSLYPTLHTLKFFGKLFLRLSLQSLIMRKKEHFSHTSSHSLALTFCSSTHHFHLLNTCRSDTNLG